MQGSVWTNGTLWLLLHLLLQLFTSGLSAFLTDTAINNVSSVPKLVSEESTEYPMLSSSISNVLKNKIDDRSTENSVVAAVIHGYRINLFFSQNYLNRQNIVKYSPDHQLYVSNRHSQQKNNLIALVDMTQLDNHDTLLDSVASKRVLKKVVNNSDILPNLCRTKRELNFEKRGENGKHWSSNYESNKLQGNRYIREDRTTNRMIGQPSHFIRHGHIPSNLRADTSSRISDDFANSVDWLLEPTEKLTFNNNTGTVLHCKLKNCNEESSVIWNYEDGRTLKEIPGLASVLPNGSLVLHPFSPRYFDPAIHTTTITCTVTCGTAALLSRPATITAVFSEKYDVLVYDQVALSGNTAVLTCLIPNAVSNVVVITSWLIDGKTAVMPSMVGDGKHYMAEDGKLYVLAASLSDSDVSYQCRTLDTLTGSTRLSGPARIIVSESSVPVPPRLLESPPRVVASLDRPVTLPCVGEGSPAPTYRWTKDGSPLTFLNDTSWPGLPDGPKLVGGSLVLPAVQVEHEGDYRCIANSSAGHASKSTLLTVNVPPSAQIRQARIKVDLGARLALQCRTTGRPRTDVTWYKDAKKLSASPRLRLTPSELTVSSVHAEDAGLYQCRAAQGTQAVAHAHAHVLLGAWAPRLLYRFIAHTLQPGPAVTLKCIARATPTPNIAWTLDGFPLPQSHRFLIGQYVSTHGDVISHVNISSVSVSDGGLYECVAHNSAGSVSHAAPLNVYGAPTIRPVGPLTAVAGETFRVMCPVGGYPIDSITWNKDGRSLPSSHRHQVSSNGTLTLTGVTRAADEGRYTCTATGRHGSTDSRDMDIRVVVPPHLGPLVFPAGTRAGMRAQSTCFVQEGDQPIEIFWEKDSVLLDSSSTVNVRQVDDFTSMLTIGNTHAQHTGNYTCFARNVAGTVSTSAFLSINVPPSWRHEPNDVSLSLGGVLEIPCQAGGFPRPEVTWERKTVSGEWITLEKLTDVAMINQFMSSTVHGSLRILENFIDFTTRYNGGDNRVHRRGFGHDSYHILNRQAAALDSSGTNIRLPRAVTSKVSFRKTINGSLVLFGALREYEGSYLCRAGNGVGSDLSKVINVKINEPPWFAERRRLVQVEVGTSARLTCRAYGDAPLHLAWTRDGAALPTGHRWEVWHECEGQAVYNAVVARFQIQPLESEGNSHVLELNMAEASSEDSGIYVCEATNAHGSSSTDFTLTVEDVPPVPSAVQVREGGSRYVVLSWSLVSPPSLHPVPVTEYIISYTEQTENNAITQEVSVLGGSHTHRLEELRPATWYSFAVAAQNKVGRSAASTALRHRTREEKPDGRPQNVQVNSPSSRSLRVRWQPPPRNTTHGRLLGYYLGLREHSTATSSQYNFTTVGGDASRTHAIVSDLRPHTQYDVVLQAFNSMGAGPASEPMLGATMQDKPSAPPNSISCVPRSSSSLVVRWAPPPARDANGIIIRYHISYVRLPTDGKYAEQLNWKTGKSSSSILSGTTESREPAFAKSGEMASYKLQTRNKQKSVQGDTIVHRETSTVLEGLMAWTNYSLSLAAATEAGMGVMSEPPIICSTLEDVPTAPDLVKAVATSPHSVIVSWSRPTDVRGTLKHFTVYWNTSGERGSVKTQATKVAPDKDHLKIKELHQEQYKMWVTASTSVGEGPSSNITRVTPSKTVAAAVWSVGGTVNAVWRTDVTMPCRAVGLPLPNITWRHEGLLVENGVLKGATILSDGSLLLSSVDRGHAGRFSCEALNSFGGDAVDYVVNVRVPPSPPTVHVTETTSSSIRLQWDVTDDGGAAVTSCTLYYRSSGGETVEITVRGDSYTVYDLRCGAQYIFYLVAHNVIGSSESSEVVEARTKGRIPEAPPQFQFVTSNSSQATLYLTQWEDGGCPITHFLVQYRDTRVQQWTTVNSEVLPSRTFAITGLMGGSSYDVRVTAHNAAGAKEGRYSVRTPMENDASSGTIWNGLEGSVSTAQRFPVWVDFRIIIPVCVSFVALLLTVIKVAICIRQHKAKSKENPNQSQVTSTIPRKSKMVSGNNSIPDLPVQPCTLDGTECSMTDCDVYQYASASYQLGCLSPPPPPIAPSSLSNKELPFGVDCPQMAQNDGSRSYATLVYQVPSLSNVDAANKEQGNYRLSKGSMDFGRLDDGLLIGSTSAYNERIVHRPVSHYPLQGRQDIEDKQQRHKEMDTQQQKQRICQEMEGLQQQTQMQHIQRGMYTQQYNHQQQRQHKHQQFHKTPEPLEYVHTKNDFKIIGKFRRPVKENGFV